MRKTTILGICAALLTPLITIAQETSIEARGLRIVGKGYGESKYGSAELRPFNWTEGTTLSLLLLHPAGGLIEIDEDASTFTEFSDDKGGKLHEGKGKFGRDPVSISFPKVSDDGKAAQIDVVASALPTKGATTLSLKGTLVAVTGTEKKKEKSEAVELKKGAEIKVGEFTFKIKTVGKPDYGDAKLAVDLEVKGDNDKIASYTFLSADGSEIETSKLGSSTMRFGKMKSITQELGLAKKVDTAVLQLELWQDLKKVEIPIDIKAGAGL